MKGNEEASKSHIKYINAFDSKDGIGSSECIEDVRKKEKKEFEERKRKRREGRDIEKNERIVLNEEKKKEAAQDRLEEERKRVERAVAQARKRKQEKDEEERKRWLYKQQHKTTMAVLEDDFVNAEGIIEEINKDWLVNFEAIKAEWVRKNVSSNHLSENQLLAIGDVSHNCLLRARAGSGKTTVLKQKIDLLLRKTTIQPDEILVLAFNSSASKEIKRKIQKEFNHLTFSTSRTFHSLAHSIVIPEKDILSGIEQSLYVESLLKKEINPSVTADIYEFFRREMVEMENLGSLLNQSDYYQMRRGSTDQTLKKDNVKSKGEKWIADFLFEHNIRYVYERSWAVDAGNKAAPYHPDFSLKVFGKITDVVLEHWGIDELGNDRNVPAHWSKSWAEYHSQMKWKRNFWREYNKKNPNNPIVLIETSIRDMRNGRESFEAILKRKLNDINVVPIKLPAEILQEKVVRGQIPKLAKSIETFIGRAKKACVTPLDLENELTSFDFKSQKEEIFAKLATRTFRRYQDALLKENRLDFDDVMSKAVEKIHQEKGEIFIQKYDRSVMGLGEVKWIMIDEYQDFSQLFYNLIDSLRSYNPKVKLFCVGDSWQAINGFAGSDLKFFDNFMDYFEETTVLDLPDNYRSQSNIVDQANAFMKGKGGVPSVAKKHDFFRSPVYKYHANDVYINYDKRDPQKIHEVYKTRLFSKGEWVNADVSFKMARLLMLCHKIIKEHPLDTTSFMILSRTGNLGYAYRNLEKFKTKLRDILKPDISQFNNFDEQVQCLSAHGSKGLEADVVIVLNADKRKFPLIHPDNLLNRILGVNIDDVFREEERLFYVAITRAKQDLYLITEKGRESEFLDKIASELTHMPLKYPPGETVAKQELPDKDSEVFGDDIPF
jgi:DNA helicase-4